MPETVVQSREVPNLQDFVALTVKQVKTLHATLTAIMADVAALRRTVLDEPEGMGLYRTNLRSAIATAKPLLDEAMQSYDQMIRQIENLRELWN